MTSRSASRSALGHWLDMLFVDHGVFRLFYNTMSPVRPRSGAAPRLWRSSHPLPHQIARAAKRGIRTIINLRGGPQDSGVYALEVAACRRHGIRLIDFPVKSRDLPTRETLQALKTLFDEIEYPALIHCKSGADRVGLVSALYLMMVEGESPEEALRHLSLRYGHVRQAKTGILDHFVRHYRDHHAAEPTPFMEWVERSYDRDALKRSFMSSWWANKLVDRILRRE